MLAGMGHSHGTAILLNVCIHTKGMLSGIAGGFLFAVIMTLFISVLSSRKDKLRERYGIEGTVLRDGAANHMVGKEAVGGWIFLTEDRF